jgi:hypothetical protein
MNLILGPVLKFIFVERLNYQSAIFVCPVWFCGLGGFGKLPPILEPLGEQFHAIRGPLYQKKLVNLAADN